MRPKLRLIGGKIPTDIFNDLGALRAEQRFTTPSRRQRSVETFARIPHDRAVAMRDIGGVGWLIVVEVDRLILKGRGRNPVRLTNHRMRELGISRQSKHHHLRQLEAAGVIKVETEARKWTVVTLLWFPVQG